MKQVGRDRCLNLRLCVALYTYPYIHTHTPAHHTPHARRVGWFARIVGFWYWSFCCVPSQCRGKIRIAFFSEVYFMGYRKCKRMGILAKRCWTVYVKLEIRVWQLSSHAWSEIELCGCLTLLKWNICILNQGLRSRKIHRTEVWREPYHTNTKY